MIIDKVLLQEANKENIRPTDSEIDEVYHKYLEKYDSEEIMLKELDKFNYTKEQLIDDIKNQVTIEKYLLKIESQNKDVSKHIEDLGDNSEIEIKE